MFWKASYEAFIFQDWGRCDRCKLVIDSISGVSSQADVLLVLQCVEKYRDKHEWLCWAPLFYHAKSRIIKDPQ